MDYEYHDGNSEWTLQERGSDFDFAARVFDGEFIEYEDARKDYGEKRYIAIGPIEGTLFAVVYTWRDGRRRLISARRANRKERDAYRRTIT